MVDAVVFEIAISAQIEMHRFADETYAGGSCCGGASPGSNLGGVPYVVGSGNRFSH